MKDLKIMIVLIICMLILVNVYINRHTRRIGDESLTFKLDSLTLVIDTIRIQLDAQTKYHYDNCAFINKNGAVID